MSGPSCSTLRPRADAESQHRRIADDADSALWDRGCGLDADALVLAYLDAGGDGLVLTRDGVFDSVVDATAFERLSIQRRTQVMTDREARAARIDAAGKAFTADVAHLAAELAEAAERIAAMAGLVVTRAGPLAGMRRRWRVRPGRWSPR